MIVLTLTIKFFQKLKTNASLKSKKATPATKARDKIIRRAALEFKDGMYGEY